MVQAVVPWTGIAVGLLLVACPFVATLGRSLLVTSEEGSRLGLANFVELFSRSAFVEATVNTFICGVGATILSCAFGCTLAWIVTRTEIVGRGWFEVLNLVPFFLSPYVGAVSWIYLAAPFSGLIPNLVFKPLGLPPDLIDIYSLGGVIWVLSLFYTPYVYLLVIGPMSQMDAALEDAARVHGARFAMTLRSVTIPLLMPALLSGALIVFVTSAGLFDIPLALASPEGIRTMPTEIYSMLQYPADFGGAAAFGVLVLVVTVLLTLLQRNYLGRRRYDVLSGKGYRQRKVQLGPSGRAAALGIELVYIGASVGLPVLALVLVSFQSIWTGTPSLDAFTLENYRYVIFDYDLTRTAIMNSLFLALVGASVGVVLAMLQAYHLQRRAGGWGLDAVLSLPLGIPGIILSLGFLILFIQTPLYATIWIILIAYVARFFPFATRGVSAMVMAVNPELEESARASGASWWQSMRWVMLPLLKPAIVAAWLMLFVIFVRELGATILLYAQGTETISVALVILSERSFGYVSALAVIQLGLLLGAFAVFRMSRASFFQA